MLGGFSKNKDCNANKNAARKQTFTVQRWQKRYNWISSSGVEVNILTYDIFFLKGSRCLSPPQICEFQIVLFRNVTRSSDLKFLRQDRSRQPPERRGNGHNKKGKCKACKYFCVCSLNMQISGILVLVDVVIEYASW